MSRYLEIARAAMRERAAEVLEPDTVDSRREYEINEIRGADPAPPSRPSDELGPEPARNRWPERARNAIPLRRCGALICRTCGALSPSPHRADCSAPRFEPCRSRWFWLSPHGALKCVACAAPADLSLVEAPKLDLFGKLDPAKATPAEIRGQEVFFGKGQCASCHQPPYYTDNLLHDLHTERFFKPELVNYVMEVGDGKIKTFALRGVKDNPPYLHDGRLLTLDDTVEFFNLVLGDKLTAQEKQDLVAFMRAL